MNEERVKQLICELLTEIGEDPEREGLKKTPERVMRAYQFLTQDTNKRRKRSSTTPSSPRSQQYDHRQGYRNLQSVRTSHAAFFGRCHIGYIPRAKLLGVSKLCRIVDVFARRLQIQERLTAQIGPGNHDRGQCPGVGVVMECRHLCKMMRGVQKQNAVMTTSSVLGCFHDEAATRAEFLALINHKT